MAVTTTQTNVAVNPARGLVFFPDGNCFNYKTSQWTFCAAYAGFGMYNANSETSFIGLVVEASQAFDFQEQTTSDVVQTATIETGAQEIAPGERVYIDGVRPLVNGGTYAVRVGTQENIGDAVTYSASTTVTARTGKADFSLTGRYARVELTITGGFTTALGLDIEGSPAGRV